MFDVFNVRNNLAKEKERLLKLLIPRAKNFIENEVYRNIKNYQCSWCDVELYDLYVEHFSKYSYDFDKETLNKFVNAIDTWLKEKGFHVDRWFLENNIIVKFNWD